MKLLHSASCKGPPLGCQIGYWWIMAILSISSVLEGVIARWWANSNAGQADALHMSLHGVFYGSILFIGFLAKKKRFSAQEETKIRLKYAYWNITFLLGFLLYLVFIEAMPKLWNSSIVYGPELIVAATMGILGTLTSLIILCKMKSDHGGYEYGEECDRGRKSSHRALLLDAIGDIAISLAILVAAINIWINPLRSWLDPVLTFIAAGVIVWQAYYMLRVLRQDELSHSNHHH